MKSNGIGFNSPCRQIFLALIFFSLDKFLMIGHVRERERERKKREGERG